MEDLFKPVSRDARQNQSVNLWIKHKGIGSFVMPTGFGKTRTALKSLQCVLSKHPTLTALVVVPTDILKEQWEGIIDSNGLGLNVHVEVINSAVKVEAKFDILILDELHRYASDLFKQIFEKIHYRLILGLTATFERLDGKHILIEKYCPIIDTITVQEALLNGWISKYKEYQVLIDVDDIDNYKVFNKEFSEHFAFFNYKFDLAEITALLVEILK